jgi:hypothetical protein
MLLPKQPSYALAIHVMMSRNMNLHKNVVTMMRPAAPA